jgi:signal transduction histidine kinase
MMLKYLRQSLAAIIFFVSIIVIVNLMLITSTALNKTYHEIVYLNILLLVIALAFGLAGYFRFEARFHRLKLALRQGGDIDSLLPRDRDFVSQIIREIAEAKNRQCEKLVAASRQNLDELLDYMTKWVHEIKIPISVSELILEKSGEDHWPAADDLRVELARTRFLVNQVLHAGKAADYSQNLSIAELNLKGPVVDAIKRGGVFFRKKNIEIIARDLNFTVMNDEKWVAYILDQILHNAGKYTGKNGRIEIRAEEDPRAVKLSIRDNGIGIRPEDQKRIFDKGFTGGNGRRTAKSTGMGLYYAKKMANKLGIGIHVRSQQNKYTEFVLSFYKLRDYYQSDMNVT